jgi:tetratricopeptide (TPR) repeat protein
MAAVLVLAACGAREERVVAPVGRAEALPVAMTQEQPDTPKQPATGLGWTISRVTDAERAMARALFAEAMELQQMGRHAEALESLKRAEAIGTAPTLRLHVGRCLAALGRMDEAIEAYRSIVDTPLDAAAPAAFRDARASAEAELQKSK